MGKDKKNPSGHPTGSEKITVCALDFLAAGFSVVPCGNLLHKAKKEVGEIDQKTGKPYLYDPKSPIGFGSWEKYKKKAMPPGRAKIDFSVAHGVGIICGEISNRIFCLDIDLKYDLTGCLFDVIQDEIPSEIFSKFLIQKTPSGGIHLLFKWPEGQTIPGNQKLASRPTTEAEREDKPNEDRKVLIETRGTGGYFCVDPTPSYYLLDGELSDIQFLSESEVETVFEVMRSLDEISEPVKPRVSGRPSKDKLTPWDDFNARGENGVQILLRHGWTIQKELGDKIALLRPGGEGAKSAWWNVEKQFLKVFSSSTPFEIDQGKVYDSAAILNVLDFGGDWKATAAHLKSEGYGSEQAEKKQKDTRTCSQRLLEYYENLNSPFYYDELLHDLVWTSNNKRMTERDENSFFLDFVETPGNNDLENKFSAYLHFLGSDRIKQANYLGSKIEQYKDLYMERQQDKIAELYSCLPIVTGYPEGFGMELFKKWFVGFVGRVMGGPVNTLMFILVGPNRTGKTEFCRSILPEELKENFFSESNPKNTKDQEVQMCENILKFYDDLDRQKETDAAEIRRLLSMDTVNYRPVYLRKNIKRRRLSSLCGTSNDMAIIKDIDNNRRIVPYEIEGVIDFAKLNAIDRRLVIGQAAALYLSGYDCRLTVEEVNVLKAHTGDFEELSIEHALVDAWVLPPDVSEDIGENMREADIALKLETISGKHNLYMKRLGQALRSAGHEKKTRWLNGKSQKCFRIKFKQNGDYLLYSNANGFDHRSTVSTKQ